MAGGWAGEEETAAPGTQGLAAIGAFVTLNCKSLLLTEALAGAD